MNRLIRCLAGALALVSCAGFAQADRYRVDMIVFLNQATPNGAPGERSAPLRDFAIDAAAASLSDAAALGVNGVRRLADSEFGLDQAWQRMRTARAFLPIQRLSWVQAAPSPANAPLLRLHDERLLDVLPSRPRSTQRLVEGEQPDPSTAAPGTDTSASPGYRQATDETGRSSFIFGDAPDPVELGEPISLYQLDGTVQLYSRRYLHLALDLRWTQLIDGGTAPAGELLPETTLRSFRLQESRRMRRGQLHYFDHPRFGVLVEVNRLEPAPG